MVLCHFPQRRQHGDDDDDDDSDVRSKQSCSHGSDTGEKLNRTQEKLYPSPNDVRRTVVDNDLESGR